MFTNAGVFASLALVANAILVPPNLTPENLGDDNAMETLAVNPFKRTVALECPGCGFATAEGNSLSWKQDAGSSLVCSPPCSMRLTADLGDVAARF